jgi:Di-haem oxidoreductase, putative peroxidase
MMRILSRGGVGRVLTHLVALWRLPVHSYAQAPPESHLGREVAIRHMQNGEEFQTPIPQLIEYGRSLFTANWTIQEGAGRPSSKGTGAPLSDATQPLVFPRAFNRISGPDANSCAGCHNQPYAGGSGDIVNNVFVLGQRFDFAEFDDPSRVRTKSSLDERGQRTNLETIGDSRMTVGMSGAGYIEMLARQMTADLQTIRNATPPGGVSQLVTKGVRFGAIARSAGGEWDVSRVEGLPAASLATRDPHVPPSLIVRPFHQAGRVVSIREFSNNAFNQHHGMQAEERFGAGKDPDGDGFVNELTRADLTAVTIFQATLPVPVEIVPKEPEVRKAAEEGHRTFMAIGCATCHIPALPLDRRGWIFTEPNPYNPPANLRPGDAPEVAVDLSGKGLPGPRLKPDSNGAVWVPAFTDLKLHNITSGPGDPNVEPLDMQEEPGSTGFYATNSKFLTRRLWGVGNTPPYFHHGQFTTMREAILAHCREADESRLKFERLSPYERDSVIEFLKTLQVLPRYSIPGKTVR